MPARITELIDKRDNVEIVLAQIAAILLVESANQQVLAQQAGRDPRLWALRVFTERSLPWSEFQEDDSHVDQTPIVNVSFESWTADARSSNTVERQKITGSFNIDCYGYGVAAETDYGHAQGDEVAALEAMRAARLVRNILMAGAYTYLGFPRGSSQFVWGRWPQSMTMMFQTELEGRTIQQVVACRLVMQVEFNEFSPQVQGEVPELIAVTVRRNETGEVYLQANYEHGDS